MRPDPDRNATPGHGSGVRTLLRASLLSLLFAMNAFPNTNRTLFDLKIESAAARWEVVNDGVMGGVSSSQFIFTNGAAVFQGNVSLENNGGFASVRAPVDNTNGAACDAFLIRIRGDGKRYKFTARTDTRWNSPQYQILFSTRPGEWQDVRLPVDRFKASFRGRALPDAPGLDPARLISVGFLIADQQSGPFRLEVESIRTVQGSVPGG